MNNIALALSGGGFRAAAFSLGTLSYLDEIKHQGKSLLESVTFISSTSGGSITNLAYSAGLASGQPFAKVYQELMQVMSGEKLIKEAFDILRCDKCWASRPEKTRNLINAFAIAYDRLIFHGKEFGLYNKGFMGTHLEELCVNATEFANGVSFRFHSQHELAHLSRGKVGNSYISFKREDAQSVADQLKIADILACSSCFPGGFEPFMFPEDFSSAKLTAARLNGSINYRNNPFNRSDKPVDFLKEENYQKQYTRFGLMDGGLADNQAVDGVNLARQRRKKKNAAPFDLIVVTDVTSYLLDGYTLPLMKKSWLQSFSLSNIAGLLLYCALAFPALLLGGLYFHWNAGYFLLLLPWALFFLAYCYLETKLTSLRRNSKRDKSTWLLMVFEYGAFFWRVRFDQLVQNFNTRLKSVGIIVMDIYLKRIRNMYYEQLYSHPETQNIVVANAIYDLSRAGKNANKTAEIIDAKGDEESKENELDDDKMSNLSPSEAIKEVAEQARLMATTLWFDQFQTRSHVQGCIVAAGQFTVCHNLLKYLCERKERLRKNQEQGEDQPDKEIWEETYDDLINRLSIDWKRFKVDPFWLYNDGRLLPSGFKALRLVNNARKSVVVPLLTIN